MSRTTWQASNQGNIMAEGDPYKLSRFVDAQEGVFETAISELKQGRKRTHWMWFIFPQLEGLGVSATSRYYAIKSREEAIAYLAHSLLGRRLVECTEIVLTLEGKTAYEIFGSPDDLKFRSSMTLFAFVSTDRSVFNYALDKYHQGKPDTKTLEILASQ
jgi:uncharacterized protein (DUF1810 family)